MFHENRIVCDYQAYDLDSFETVGNVRDEFKDIVATSAVAFNEWLVFGHEKLGMITLFSWNRMMSKYSLFLKKHTLWKGDINQGPMCITHMKVAYSDINYCIIFVIC